MPFPSLLPRKPKWENPEESTGDFIGCINDGRFGCWEAKGRARAVFVSLSPKIHEFLDQCSTPSSGEVHWSMYMIGRSKATVSPQLVICSTDSNTRKDIRKRIRDSGIMAKYPGIGLADMDSLPDRPNVRSVTHEGIEALLPPGCHIDDGVVFIDKDVTDCMGARIFVVTPETHALRPATGGPVLYHAKVCYQLTVHHAFTPATENFGPIPAETSGHAMPYCDFDGMSDEDDEAEEMSDVEMTGRGSLTPDDMRSELTMSTTRDSDLNDSHIVSSFACSLRLNQSAKDPTKGSQAISNPTDLGRLRYFGRLARDWTTRGDQSPDYALIEIADDTEQHCSKTYLSIRAMAKASQTIALEDAEVQICLPGRAFVRGKICATPIFWRAEEQGTWASGGKTFNKVYSVRLQVDDVISDGDCGAAVIGATPQTTHQLYGHVVAGSVGSRIAYILPAKDIANDLIHQITTESDKVGKHSRPRPRMAGVSEVSSRDHIFPSAARSVDGESFYDKDDAASLFSFTGTFQTSASSVAYEEDTAYRSSEPWGQGIPHKRTGPLQEGTTAQELGHVEGSYSFPAYLTRPVHLASQSSMLAGYSDMKLDSPVDLFSPSRASQRYACNHKGCTKTFARAADLDRHMKHVHRSDSDKDLIYCDSPHCDRTKRPFHRSDHFREHLREYHKEDLYRPNKTESADWLLTRNIRAEWWRCRGCLQRVPSAFGVEIRWECGNCGTKCEDDRQAIRQARFDEVLVREAEQERGYDELVSAWRRPN
jgi:hypothetical protein